MTMPKHARIGDMLDVLHPKYRQCIGEFAFDMLDGEPWKYSTVMEYAETWLSNRDWESEANIRIALEQENYHHKVIASALKRLNSVANIGTKRLYGQTWFKWYEEKEGDELSQKALDDR